MYPVLCPEGHRLKKQNMKPPRRSPPPCLPLFTLTRIQCCCLRKCCMCQYVAAFFFQHLAASPWLNALTVITILCCHHFLWYTMKMMYLQHRHRSFSPSFLLGWHPCTVRESVQEAGVSIYWGCVQCCGVCVLFYWSPWIQLCALTVLKLTLQFSRCVWSTHKFK